MSEPIRAGVLEVENLRRYGRTPPGTRARGSFSLRDGGNAPEATLSRYYLASFRFEFDNDPRLVALAVGFWWTGDPRRGKGARAGVTGAETDLLSYARRLVVEEIEAEVTSRGNQHFRVIRAEWDAE